MLAVEFCVGDAVFRLGSEFFKMDAFGFGSSARVGVGAGDALDDSLEEFDSLLADRTGFFCGAGVPDLAVEDCREQLVRSDSS